MNLQTQSPQKAMNDDHNGKLLDHEIDGIREFDNSLPRWWVWLFYFTIVFAFIYMIYYHVLKKGDLQYAQYSHEMKMGDVVKTAAMNRFSESLEKLQPSTDPKILEKGHALYLKMCAPCHRSDAGGLVGPNLTDDYWIHGSKFNDNIKTIWNGIPTKGMVTWKGVLKPDEVLAIASYIYTLRGTKPENPKLPENMLPATPAINEYE